MMSVSDSEAEKIIISCLLIDEEERKKKMRKRKRLWVHSISKKRLEYGEYHTLFPDLLADDVKFFQYHRMTHDKFTTLFNILTPDLNRENTSFRMAVGPKERLLLCLRYLATGNSFRSLAFNYRLGERTVREIVYSCCEVVWRKLRPIVMPTPDEAMWLKIENDFNTKWDFPNLIGAIDGKYVVIQAPPHSGSQFFCYKKTFSTVLLALVDANYKFIAIDVGAYGKNSDGSIFSNSNLGKGLNNNALNIPPGKQLPGRDEYLPFVIIGDEAFPLRTYLMRPYSRDKVNGNEEKKIFNYRLSRARNVSENCFGILTRKFRIFEHK